MRVGYWFVTAISVVSVATGCSDISATQDVATQRQRRLLQVRVAPVTRGSVSTTLELVGNLLPKRRSIIVAEVDGVIQAMPKPETNPVVMDHGGVQEVLPLGIGSVVGKGDQLIRLDPTDYERELKVAEAKLEKAKRDLEDLLAWDRPEEVRRLEALTEEALAAKENAELEFERTRKLLADNAVSEKDHYANELVLRRTRALLAHAQAKLDISKAGPTKEEVAVAQAAIAAAEAEVEHTRWKVERCTIVAPYDAVITDRYMDEGDRVTAFPRVEILEVMDVRYVVAEVGVPEQFGEQIKLLDRAIVHVKGMSEDIPGLIVRINDKIDPASRTFRIRVAVDNASRRFRVGQFVRVLLAVDATADALIVPRQAITFSGGQPQVFVLTESTVRLRPIELGIQSEHQVEVISGLKENEQVVVQDPAVLSDGMQVQVVSDQRAVQSASRSNL